MEERYLSVREFAELLGVSRSTVISWIKSSRIIAYNVHGRWKIPYSEVEKILRGVQRIRRLAIYARVSSNTQKDDLERQVEALKLGRQELPPSGVHGRDGHRKRVGGVGLDWRS